MPNLPAGSQRYELAGFAKDEIYDLVNLIMHDAATLWQFVSQDDVEEALDELASIRSRCAEIDLTCKDGALPSNPQAQAAVPDATATGDCDGCGACGVPVVIHEGAKSAHCYCAECEACRVETKEGN